ncbi:helix-turn-helix domain-containing protein [Peribacillus acanthi]|uniref:helix-turn-helix domain-containing protein n=1 Tax=Peribacillus acanthi TaxID=2171554 RepID=UPI000D3E7625|nr:helix-turn-helix transcriptional regulator [Peribacillus acanthi]
MDAQKLKIIRIKKGISQKRLAELVDADYSYINMIENGRKVPSLALLERIANALDCSLKDFF